MKIKIEFQTKLVDLEATLEMIEILRENNPCIVENAEIEIQVD